MSVGKDISGEDTVQEQQGVTLDLQGDADSRIKITRDQYAVLFAVLQMSAFFDHVIINQSEVIDETYKEFTEQSETATVEQLEELLLGLASNLSKSAEKSVIASHIVRKFENVVLSIKAQQPIANPE